MELGLIFRVLEIVYKYKVFIVSFLSIENTFELQSILKSIFLAMIHFRGWKTILRTFKPIFKTWEQTLRTLKWILDSNPAQAIIFQLYPLTLWNTHRNIGLKKVSLPPSIPFSDVDRLDLIDCDSIFLNWALLIPVDVLIIRHRAEELKKNYTPFLPPRPFANANFGSRSISIHSDSMIFNLSSVIIYG